MSCQVPQQREVLISSDGGRWTARTVRAVCALGRNASALRSVARWLSREERWRRLRATQL